MSHNSVDLRNELREVRRIKRAATFRDVLKISDNANPKTIEKAYHRIARIVHPDNAKIRQHLQKHPNDEREFSEAFQKLGEAKRKLLENGNTSDNNSREPDNDNDGSDDGGNDDRNEGDSNVGNDEPNHGNNAGFTWDNRFDNSSDDRGYWWQTLNGIKVLVCSPAILLIVLPLVVSILYFAVAPKPIFRLKRDAEFVTKNHTKFGKIPYFVRIEGQFRAELQKRYDTWDEFEWDVITAYEHKLHVKCNRENNKDKLLEEYRISGNRKTYMDATSEGTPSCDKLGKIRTWKKSNPLRWKKWSSFLDFF